MKIGIDASRYVGEKATGVEWYSWHIIRGLLQTSAKGEEIILYSRNKLNPKDYKIGKAKVKNKIIDRKRLWTLKGLSDEMKKNAPDVLFVPSHTLPLNLPKRSVITIHDVAFKRIRSSYSFTQYHYLNWSTKFAVKKASQIIVPSEATANDLVEFYNCDRKKIMVVPHGFVAPESFDKNIFKDSPALSHFGIGPKMKYLLFVGRLESKKNLVRLIEAFAKFHTKNPDYKLILAGKRGYGFKDIWAKVRELNVVNHVIMPGYITEEEKAALYSYCQAFLFPSLYEGFGLPILEAFYYGKPVMVSDNSSLPEVAGKCGIYVDPYKVESISKGLVKVLKLDGAKGKKLLGNFSWEEAAKKTLSILKEKSK